MKKLAGLLTACTLGILASTHTFADDAPDRDGNWWRTLDKTTKNAYMTGFFDGINLGHDFSYWDWASDTKQYSCFALTQRSFNNYASRYLSKVTSGQVADGLDDFYKDFRNRSIEIPHAAWIVLNEIAGTPKPQLDEMIGNWRRGAAKN